MDIEWAQDGCTGELFIVQARPETVQSRRRTDSFESYQLERRAYRARHGAQCGRENRPGPVRVIKDANFLGQFQAGEILVTEKTDPDWEPIMKKAAAIVTNQGGRTCHAAIVAANWEFPASLVHKQRTGTLEIRAGHHGLLRGGRRGPCLRRDSPVRRERVIYGSVAEDAHRHNDECRKSAGRLLPVIHSQ